MKIQNLFEEKIELLRLKRKRTREGKQCVIIPNGLSASAKHTDRKKCLSAPQQSHHQTKPWCCEAAAENRDNKLFGFVMTNFQTLFITLDDSDKGKLQDVQQHFTSRLQLCNPHTTVALFGS